MKELFLKGIVFACGLILVALIAGLAYLAYDTRQKAIRGNAAADFIERVNQPKPPVTDPATK